VENLEWHLQFDPLFWSALLAASSCRLQRIVLSLFWHFAVHRSFAGALVLVCVLFFVPGAGCALLVFFTSESLPELSVSTSFPATAANGQSFLVFIVVVSHETKTSTGNAEAVIRACGFQSCLSDVCSMGPQNANADRFLPNELFIRKGMKVSELWMVHCCCCCSELPLSGDEERYVAQR
jgi:hypothetical protein